MDDAIRAAVEEANIAEETRFLDQELGIMWIRTHNMPIFKKRLAAVNRRAAKLGVQEMSYKKLAEVSVPVVNLGAYNGPKITHHKEWTIVLPSSIRVSLSGWTLVAKITHLPEGNFISTCPGEEMSRAHGPPGP
jgi:hypothetical protein